MHARLPLLLLLLTALAGCAFSPRALGITGAAPPMPPRRPGDAVLGLPGLPQSGGAAAVSFGNPGSGAGGRYYGNN